MLTFSQSQISNSVQALLGIAFTEGPHSQTSVPILSISINVLDFFADVEFSAIVDPNTELAHQRIADLQKGKYAEKWSKTKVFPQYRELLNAPVRF